jgi:hypothetical protein
MDQLEFEKAKQLRKIAEARETTEPTADFTVKRFADGHYTTAVNGSLIEIALMVTQGLHNIEKLHPEARIAFATAFRDYLEG